MAEQKVMPVNVAVCVTSYKNHYFNSMCFAYVTHALVVTALHETPVPVEKTEHIIHKLWS